MTPLTLALPRGALLHVGAQRGAGVQAAAVLGLGRGLRILQQPQLSLGLAVCAHGGQWASAVRAKLAN